MGEKIIVIMLFVCMGAGIASGPHLWQKAAKERRPEEKQVTTAAEETETEVQEEEVDDSIIRVLISTDTLGNYRHDSVSVTSEQEYYVRIGEETVKKQAGEVTSLKYDKKKKGQTVVFSGTGKLEIRSLRRSYGHPSYRGILTVKYGSSALTVVNQLLLEEYLYAVVPSEMPVSYGIEALKTQAVCARSFAVRQKEGDKFRRYGADVDDSVSSQVYNNTKECEESIRAVLETAGEVVAWKNQVIGAYFFSTSWGHTADSHDVWLQKGKSPVYLRGKLQQEDGEALDLSQEEDLKAFLESDEITYDSGFSWYRWKVEIPVAQLSRDHVGSIRDVRVTKRGKSGVATELRITGSGGVRVIQGEYKIRQYLSPGGNAITRKDGSQVKAQVLPSGCFYIEETENALVIRGGGYGHGVGMSQNGAKAQAEQGKTYREILEHYYSGTQIKDRSECE